MEIGDTVSATRAQLELREIHVMLYVCVWVQVSMQCRLSTQYKSSTFEGRCAGVYLSCPLPPFHSSSRPFRSLDARPSWSPNPTLVHTICSDGTHGPHDGLSDDAFQCGQGACGCWGETRGQGQLGESRGLIGSVGEINNCRLMQASMHQCQRWLAVVVIL